jgi:hypothetical protein
MNGQHLRNEFRRWRIARRCRETSAHVVGRAVVALAYVRRNSRVARYSGFFLTVLVCATRVASAHPASSEKMLSYRVSDMESGQEAYRENTWQQADAGVPATWSEKKFANGEHSIDECLFANGYERPATSMRSVLARGVELESSDFEVFDPAFYPFLRQPLPAGAVPAACAGESADLGALVAGKEISLAGWSDYGYAIVTLHPAENETITVPAGTYDSLRFSQELDVSNYLGSLPLVVRHFIKTPVTRNWIERAPPYYELKSTREGSGTEPKTLRELTEVAEQPTNAPSTLLGSAQRVPPDPVLSVVNAGRVTQGDLSGRATMSATATPEGELLVVRLAFSNGLALEDRSLLDYRAPPLTRYVEQRAYAPDGKLVRRRVSNIREPEPSEEKDKGLPSPLYPYAMTLALVLPRMLSDATGTVSLHVMGSGGGVTELVLRGSGYETLDLNGRAMKALHAHLQPNVHIPLLLRPIVYFFIPQYDVYFEANTPARLLKFDGPLGPPGAPEAHMVADAKVSDD